ncbi:transporter substrate-binding domain-containing protein [Streptomyces sp. NBC_01005]|uniref:transporter substrate-binding domain-containing protein n=1 Tax=unclassified Streptomyces TaxID=2593676 RepID=UPI0038706310|nr:transporter substrate-binding domain-containing protein [Streptomyces sp. NBC_01005]WTC96759.1 transporter substrate-binding domain-containing protein [Streptomyces sp. NBC_01650]
MTVVALALAGCSSEPESFLVNGVDVGVKGDQPGTSSLFADGDYRGFDVTIAEAVLRGVGVDDPNPQGVLSRNRVNDLRKGKVKLVAATFSITPDRMKPRSANGDGLDFVGPYAVTHQGMLVRADESGFYDDIKKFNKKNVCVWEETTSAKLLEEPAYKGIGHTTVTDAKQCIEGLKKGTYDAVSTDQLILYGFAKENPELAVVENVKIGPPNKYGIAMVKGHREDCARLKKSLLKYLGGDGWSRAFDEYLKLPVKPGMPDMSDKIRESARPTTEEIEDSSCVDKLRGS